MRRPLLRYAASEQIDELMLVTTVRRHLAGLADEIGKPLARVLLRGGLWVPRTYGTFTYHKGQRPASAVADRRETARRHRTQAPVPPDQG